MIHRVKMLQNRLYRQNIRNWNFKVPFIEYFTIVKTLKTSWMIFWDFDLFYVSILGNLETLFFPSKIFIFCRGITRVWTPKSLFLNFDPENHTIYYSEYWWKTCSNFRSIIQMQLIQLSSNKNLTFGNKTVF